MGLDALWPVLVGFGLLGWLWSLNLVWRHRCRHLPGPRPSWLIGNVVDFKIGKATEALQEWASVYGPVFVWYMGRKPCIVLSDPDLIHEAAVNRFPQLHDRSMFQLCPGMKIEADFMNKGLFSSTGKAWAHGRALLQKFFTREELAKHALKMNTSANKLMEIMATAASSGSEFEATDTFSKMTLEVIGTTAFGVDFHLQTAEAAGEKWSPTSSSSSLSGPFNSVSDLLAAAKSLFQPLRLRGIAGRIALGFSPVLVWLQHRGLALGGRIKTLKMISLARCFIWGALYEILENSSSIDSAENVGSTGKKANTIGSDTEDDEEKQQRGLQCPMRYLGKIRANSFSKGKKTLSNLVPETPALFKLLKGAVDPQTEKPLTKFDICAQAFNMIVGAYETTALALSYTLYELAKQPELQRRIAQEAAALRALKKQKLSKTSTEAAAGADDDEDSPLVILFEEIKHLQFTEACLLEGIRLWPPVTPLLPLTRHAKEEVHLNGYRIPKGSCLMFNVWGIHHNPEYYANPDTYTPERFLPDHPEMKTRHRHAYFPFGAGPRKCVGKAFAVAEAVITLAKLLEKFEFRLDTSKSAELDLSTSVTLQPTNGIWLKVFKREEEES